MLKLTFRFLYLTAFILVVLGLSGAAFSQTNRKGIPPKTAKPKPTPTPMPQQTDIPPTPPVKRNERPSTGDIQSRERQGIELNAEQESEPSGNTPYRYEFTRPEFNVDKIIIEHDETGQGRIFFRKKDLDDMLSDPIQLSPETVAKLNEAFDALNFLNSKEDYQYEKDYSHLGNISITLRKNGRERTAKYNWTENTHAKFLMDEYRRVANQFLWIFDVNLARENQPLETPKLLDTLDSYIARNEVADPRQMVPFLTALSNDERVPLIGRNHAQKLIKKIEKQKK